MKLISKLKVDKKYRGISLTIKSTSQLTREEDVGDLAVAVGNDTVIWRLLHVQVAGVEFGEAMSIG
jgi:hypothetical protein